jgi:hypothetical protein
MKAIRGNSSIPGAVSVGGWHGETLAMTGLLQKELGVIKNLYYEASVMRAPSAPPLQERFASMPT